MGEACLKFDTPVTGGNVSFYNQGPDGPVFPTPTIGMVGLLEDINLKMTLFFKEAGNLIYLIGDSSNDINSSEYLHKICKVDFSPAPAFELEHEFNVQQAIALLIREKLIASAHDIAEGGLFVTLCESGFHHGLGFEINTDKSIRKDAYLFGEAQSRVVVSIQPSHQTQFEQAMATVGVNYSLLGSVTTENVGIDGEDWGTMKEWKHQYDTAIEKIMGN
jgi:phosphoribosylformylglycinamidine synthase